MMLLMLALHLPFLTQASQVQIRTIDAKPWRVVVAQDRFTGAVRCSALGRHVILQDGVVVFDLGAHTDTKTAVYRIDRGPARSDIASPPQSLDQRLVDRTPLDNPSNGLVSVPLDVLMGARQVDVRANPNSRPTTFDMTGLDQALKIEVKQACAGSTLAAAD